MNAPFRPPGAQKTAKTTRFGPSAVNRIDGCDGTEISVVLPLEIIRIGGKTARYGPFFCRKSVFTRRQVRAGGTKLPFRCNSLRRSTPAGKHIFFIILISMLTFSPGTIFVRQRVTFLGITTLMMMMRVGATTYPQLRDICCAHSRARGK